MSHPLRALSGLNFIKLYSIKVVLIFHNASQFHCRIPMPGYSTAKVCGRRLVDALRMKVLCDTHRAV